MLDSGDVVLMEHNCLKALSVNEMRFCFTHKLLKAAMKALDKNPSTWDSVGLLLRDKNGPRVIFSFFNKIYDLEYDEFLRIPFFTDVALRRLKTPNLQLGIVSREFRAFIYNQQEQRPWNVFTGTFENGVEIVHNYWIKAKLTDEKKNEKKTAKIEDIDSIRPYVLNHQIASYTEPIIVRTKNSKNETQNY